MLRKSKRNVGSTDDLSLPDRSDLQDDLADKDAALRIHAILHTLKEPYKEVFSLRVFGELRFEEIGRLFGKSAGWARVTYYRAKMMIQNELEDSDE